MQMLHNAVSQLTWSARFALFFGANFSYQMRDNKRAIGRAWKAIEHRLESSRVP